MGMRRGFAAVAAMVIALTMLSAAPAFAERGRQAEHRQGDHQHDDRRGRPRPTGPVADLAQELNGGNGVFMGAATPESLVGTGYVQHEYVAAGTASSYRAMSALSADGRWNFAPDTAARYRTRVLVRRPADEERFSGNVVVEWLNVSGGLDADPDYTTLHEELLRRGDVWVGVSAQVIGVEGGPVLVTVNVPGAEAAGKGLKKIDPARYGTLQHPGDGFSFDIFTQVARAIRAGAGMDGLRAKRIIAAGESQSAFALVTYFNGVQPLAHAFDGFFVHSRGAVGLPLVGPGKFADIASAISGTPTIFRTDEDAPVLDIQTETDVASILDSYAARQPDNEHFRLWEVPGTAHADAHLLGATAKYIDCGVPINNGPMHVVAKAALHALVRWLTTGDAPPHAARIEVDPATKQIRRDADGIALGGIRTPPVDVAAAVLSGAPGPNPSVICLLLGSTRPLSMARLAQLYPSRDAYAERYEDAADTVIEQGFVLRADRSTLLAFADPSRIPG
jgi:hypothetical protein